MSFTSIENNNSGLMKEGDYEVSCVKCEETVTKTTSAPVIKFDFVVRSDVEQAYQKKHIFKNFYQDDTGAWPDEKIGKYANSLGIEKGADFELDDLIGRDCIVRIKHFEGDDKEMRECIFFTAPTKHPRQEFLPVGDDSDLPF